MHAVYKREPRTSSLRSDPPSPSSPSLCIVFKPPAAVRTNPDSDSRASVTFFARSSDQSISMETTTMPPSPKKRRCCDTELRLGGGACADDDAAPAALCARWEKKAGTTTTTGGAHCYHAYDGDDYRLLTLAQHLAMVPGAAAGRDDVTGAGAEVQASAIIRMARAAAGAHDSDRGASRRRRSLGRFLQRRREVRRARNGGASNPQLRVFAHQTLTEI